MYLTLGLPCCGKIDICFDDDLCTRDTAVIVMTSDFGKLNTAQLEEPVLRSLPRASERRKKFDDRLLRLASWIQRFQRLFSITLIFSPICILIAFEPLYQWAKDE